MTHHLSSVPHVQLPLYLAGQSSASDSFPEFISLPRSPTYHLLPHYQSFSSLVTFQKVPEADEVKRDTSSQCTKDYPINAQRHLQCQASIHDGGSRPEAQLLWARFRHRCAQIHVNPNALLCICLSIWENTEWYCKGAVSSLHPIEALSRSKRLNIVIQVGKIFYYSSMTVELSLNPWWLCVELPLYSVLISRYFVSSCDPHIVGAPTLFFFLWFSRCPFLLYFRILPVPFLLLVMSLIPFFFYFKRTASVLP